MIRAAVVALLALAGGGVAAEALATAGTDPVAPPRHDAADALLMRMSEAARSVNYQGVVVYQSQNQLDTLRVLHGFSQGVELERVEALTGEPREIVKRDGKVICLLPRDRRVMFDRPTPKNLFVSLTPERIAQLAPVYRIENLGQARVAGRRCNGLAITPRDDFRYGYRVWADAQTHVPLKVHLVAPGGQVLEQMMFTEVQFPAQIDEADFEPALRNDPRVIEQARGEAVPSVPAPPLPATEQIPAFQLGQLPPGFRVTLRTLQPAADGQGMVEHVVVTDGLTAVSVFGAPQHDHHGGFEGQSQMGAIHAFGRVIGAMRFTVVGEAPSQTIRLIGEGVQTPQIVAEPAHAAP
ncbi:MucB/RseB C-terminal domain-containing protein [Sinimarinibacterium sp. NLF-5-8]|uniref:MucB/RseB C-terminal domain-containing protein n=1 Tax=Sinimarinibacterium sp. NLF-5-8 TaxID=2698684 RepID=UPI00137C2C6D|nr:MucB/RseB C-terminal domain-containing protein [Sinimarinibacterium sp. NLF-5-8]QHS09834.1 hypothetical protein GT972_06460 [Sinimarinibacterium sp. NLF-5-8]